MTKESYEKTRVWFLERPFALKMLKVLNKWLPRIVYCAYPALLIVLIFRRDPRLLRVILVPAAALFAVTAARKLINLPRPYEILDIEPLIPHRRSGDSFPSRHAAAATVIAAAFSFVWWPLGVITALIAFLICFVRPLSGIHFPRDVIAGAALSIVISIVGFIIIK